MKLNNMREEAGFVLLERGEGHWEVWTKDTDRKVHEERGKWACLACFQWAMRHEGRRDAQAKAS